MFDFPNSPTLNQVVNASNGSFTWDGVKWVASKSSFPPVIATIAALRASTTVTLTAAQCTVQSFAGTTNKGGGVFIYVSTDTTSADNGGTIVVDASSRRWYRLGVTVAGPLNVYWFGAVGDGATNDTTAIQATYNALPAAGGVVMFPTGTYLISAAIVVAKNNTITEGCNSEILTNSATADHFQLGVVGGVNNLVFRDLSCWSTVVKTAGACFRGLGQVNDSNWYSVQCGALTYYGASSLNYLWNGLDFTLGLGRVYIDPGCMILTQWRGVIVGPGAELYLDGRILFCAYGVILGGGFGGAYFNGEFSQCGTGVWCDTSINSATNREVFFEERAIIDSCKDYSVAILANSVAILDVSGSWFTSAGQVITGGQGVGMLIQPNAGLTNYGSFKISGARFYNNKVTGFVNGGMQGMLSGCMFNFNGAGAVLEDTGANGSSIDSCNFENNIGLSLAIQNGINMYAVTNNFFVGNGSAIGGGSVSFTGNCYIRGNVGYNTRFEGLALMASGTNSITFNHNLPALPAGIQISANQANHTFAVGPVTVTQVTVQADSNLTATGSIWWTVSLGPNA